MEFTIPRRGQRTKPPSTLFASLSENDLPRPFKDRHWVIEIWDNVALLEASDFARTLGTNGQGTDHAWGGHHIVMGGDVKGGQMLGQYPARLDEASDVNIGRNHRMLPTMPWEALWNGIALWFGASSASVPTIIPNAANFPEASLLSLSQLMKPARRR